MVNVFSITSLSQGSYRASHSNGIAVLILTSSQDSYWVIWWSPFRWSLSRRPLSSDSQSGLPETPLSSGFNHMDQSRSGSRSKSHLQERGSGPGEIQSPCLSLSLTLFLSSSLLTVQTLGGRQQPSHTVYELGN